MTYTVASHDIISGCIGRVHDKDVERFSFCQYTAFLRRGGVPRDSAVFLTEILAKLPSGTLLITALTLQG